MIDLDRVSKSYEKGQPAVDEISLHVDKGEFVFVVGESGSGKSTLIRLLLKELEPTKGIITVNGHVLNTMKHKAVSKYRREVGVVDEVRLGEHQIAARRELRRHGQVE